MFYNREGFYFIIEYDKHGLNEFLRIILIRANLIRFFFLVQLKVEVEHARPLQSFFVLEK